MRKLILFGVVAVAAAAAVAMWSGGLQAAERRDAGGLKPAAPQETKGERRLQVRVTSEMIRHSRLNDVLYFADFLYGAGALLLILAAGWSAHFRDIAER